MPVQPMLIGHRGARGEAPENTFEGFEWAWAQGIRSFEFDLQLSADNQIFILHDDDLLRTCGVAGRAAERSLAELQQMDGRKVGPPWPLPCRIPSLQQLLQLLLQAPGDVEQVQLEVKTADPSTLERLCDHLSAALAKLPDALRTKCVVTSFNPLVPKLIRQAAVPDLRQGLAIEEAKVLESLLVTPSATYDLIALNHQLLHPQVVDQLHAKGFEVSCWTVNASQDWARGCAAGVDSIITDYPHRLLQILQNRF